jgi:hypothetical protein
MKLTWHIIKNDVVRDRWALLLWGLLFVARVVIGLVLLHTPGADRQWIMWMEIANGALAGLGFLIGYVLVARLVLADPLLGTDMFWATRPLSRGRLLAAKVGGALLVYGLLPVALLMPWWIWCGFDARGIFWTAVDTFGWQLLMIAPALLIASMTNEISRVLLWTVLLGVALMLWATVLANLFQHQVGDPLREFVGLGYTRFWLSCLLFVVFAIAVTAHQYLTRRLFRSGVLTAVTAGAVVAIGLFSRTDVSEVLTRLPQRGTEPGVQESLEGVKVEVGSAMPNVSPSSPARKNDDASLVTEVYFQGLPEGIAIISGTSRQVWRWPSGQEIARWSYVGSGHLPSADLLMATYKLAPLPPDPETARVIAERQRKAAEEFAARRVASGASAAPPRRKIVPPSLPGSRSLVYSTVPKALIARGQAEPPAYEVLLRCVATESVILTEMPLQVGAQGGWNSQRARLLSIGESPHPEAALSILVTAPRVQTSGLWLVSEIVRDVRDPLRGEVWSVNRTSGELLKHGNYSLRSTRTSYIAGVLMSWNQSNFRAGLIFRDGKLLARDPQWAEHTTLVLVAEQAIARFSKKVSVEKLQFRPSLWLTEPAAEAVTND